MKRRGQFTLFIIVGIVIFFVFGFALYARAKIMNSQLGQQADVQLKNYLTNNAINQYVTSCLDAVTDETILLATMQGGLLNSTQKQKNIDYVEYYNPVLNRTFNVSIAIDTNNNCPDNRPKEQYIVTNDPGPYPYNCVNAYLRDLPEKYITYKDSTCGNNCTLNDFWIYSGFFGINNLPMLCNPNGVNAREVVAGKNSYTCDYYADYNTSMQQLLEEKISHDMNSCINFTEILKRTPSNITKVGEVNASITFSKGGFSVNLEYPFTILMRNRQPLTRMVDFNVDKEIPFKELYEYTYELANYDVKDVKFDVFNNKDKVISQSIRWIGMNNNLYSSNYIIDIMPGNADNGYINIIQVIDINHNIRGFPLTINFAVKNRRPALEYINEGNSLKYDLTTTENRTLLLAPQGYDPDDEKDLTYLYEGWLENYNDYYNWNDAECANPTSMDYILEHCTKQNEILPEHNWTKSEPYINSNQNASYSTTHNDIGLHNVKIKVYDRSGLEDFQIVRILIFDLPLARINGSNIYSDVDDKYASYEDPYILNGSESTVGAISSMAGIRFSTFLWNDTTEPFNITKDITDALSRAVMIPQDTTLLDAPLTIMNIKDKIFNGTLLGPGNIIDSKKSKMHEILLTVTTDMPASDTNKFYLNVTQCLNHSSSTPAYPYDTLIGFGVLPDDTKGHLMANHTCCTNTMEYRESDEECFRVEKYGPNNSFQDFNSPTIRETDPYTIDYDHQPIGNYANDIYKQTFVRKCSGDRGNVCTGDISESRNVSERECQDDNGLPNPAFSKERCSGPDNDIYRNANSATPNIPNPLCKDYSPGETFEELFNVDNGDGNCIDSSYPEELCSNGLKFRAYDSSGNNRYVCTKGQCSEGECSKPVTASCQCNSNCGSDDKCINLAYGSSWDGSPRECTSFGQTYFRDICDSCALRDEDNVCRAQIDGNNVGCTAALECDGTPASSNPTQATCLIGTSIKARCGSTCQLEDDSNIANNICTTVGRNCDGSESCNGIAKGSTSHAGLNTYCDTSCEERNCGAYVYRGGHACPSTCLTNADCLSTTCEGPIENKRCLLAI